MGPAMAPKILGLVRQHWRRPLALLTPVILLPVFAVRDTKETRCAYGILVICFYWVFELVHISITSLLPVFIFPILGVLTTAQSTAPYMKDTIMMYLAGMIMAAAVEHCQLHYRLALRTLLYTGAHTIWVMFGLMLTSMTLSMWLNNMATTLMILPIVDAVVCEISRKTDKSADARSSSLDARLDDVRQQRRMAKKRASQVSTTSGPDVTYGDRRQLHQAMLLAVAYAANIGGTGSLIGTPPNLVLLGLIEDQYPDATELTFASWMFYSVPPMVVCMCFTWFYLYYVCVPKRYRENTGDQAGIRGALEQHYRNLGSMTFHEGAVLTIFLLTVLVWFFRDPYLIPGWTALFTLKRQIRGATPAIFSVALLFLIPARPMHEPSGPSLIEWYVVQRKTPWGVLLLMGGSLALSEASQVSGLGRSMGLLLTKLEFLPEVVVLAILCVFTAMITEVSGNTATASIVLPVVSYLARAMRIHPLYLMIPVTISASFAFMLPVASPPNALVYEHGDMKSSYMARIGILINLACIAIQLLFVNTLGVLTFDLNEFPSWAEGFNDTEADSSPWLAKETTHDDTTLLSSTMNHNF